MCNFSAIDIQFTQGVMPCWNRMLSLDFSHTQTNLGSQRLRNNFKVTLIQIWESYLSVLQHQSQRDVTLCVIFVEKSQCFRIRESDTSCPRSNLYTLKMLVGHCNGHLTSRSRIWINFWQIPQVDIEGRDGGGGGAKTGARHILTQYQQLAYPDPSLGRRFLDQWSDPCVSTVTN